MSDGWTEQERRDLALAAPELAGMSRDEVMRLMERYPTDPALRALAEGRPTQGSINEAAQHDAKLQAALARRYPTMFRR